MSILLEAILDDLHDFKQTVFDHFENEQSKQQKRHDEIMAQGSDIQAKIAAMSAAVDALKAAFDKHVAGASETIPAGHAAVLDTFMGPMDEVMIKMGALGKDIAAAAIPVPGVAPK